MTTANNNHYPNFYEVTIGVLAKDLYGFSDFYEANEFVTRERLLWLIQLFPTISLFRYFRVGCGAK